MKQSEHWSRRSSTQRKCIFTRNPSFLSVLVIAIGWALFYGSLSILIGALVAWVAFNFLIVPREEHDLEARFGESYLEYKNKVPRWLGKARR